ncbi:uncharacterized protein LOC133796318 [Humulus lupulus]|uniref:uncharacterized protein LOC133796318 n=1 Tax=Humulus lupulus TaxID=3486 RepID=UPI002B40F407|nr:uncharacterized protein LOC133796318 [Humulus lupulus]
MERRMEALFEKRAEKEGEGILLMTMAVGSCSLFDMEKSVCNHGMFMMPPNVWIPSSKSLQRPLRLADDATSLTLSVSQSNHYLYVRHFSQHSNFSMNDQRVIQEQIVRMLRITESDARDVREFHKVCPRAKETGFGRLFRSPSLFEDAVKSILLCNCTWGRTLKMAEALCKLQYDISQNNVDGVSSRTRGVKRKLVYPKENEKVMKIGNFPNAREIVSRGENDFMERMSPVLGYRAKHIFKLAKDVHSGKLSVLRELEEASEKRLCREDMIINKIRGFGPFACANILMCVGHYQKVPVDSETIRHLQQIHGRKKCNKKTIQKEVKEIYDKYAPFQCLAYWMELLEYYENKFGKLSQLPQSSYHTISGSKL